MVIVVAVDLQQDVTGLAFELGRQVQELGVQQELSPTELARRAGVTQPAVVRFDAGGAVPTLPLLVPGRSLEPS